MENAKSLIHHNPFWNYEIEIPLPSEKIAILVNALRLVSKDDEIKSREILIPNDCDKYGFSEGEFNLSTMLHFLADMLEE